MDERTTTQREAKKPSPESTRASELYATVARQFGVSEDWTPTLTDALDGGNPFLDAFLEASGGQTHGALDSPYDTRADFRLLRHRFRLVHHYAWAVPTAPALDLLGATGEVVEVGAGGGYWAAMLRARGVAVHAYDPEPGNNHWVDKLWTVVAVGPPEAAGDHPSATLFLCWPIQSAAVAEVALDRHLAAGGTRLVYVGEHEGGCCASDAFFRSLEREMREVDRVGLPQFPAIHDHLSVWERRRSSL